MRIKIVVLCLGNVSNGEAAIFSESVKAVDRNRFQFCVVSSGLGAKYFCNERDTLLVLKATSPLENLIRFKRFVEESNPHVFLCADLATMNDSKVWTGIDIDLLKKYDLPVGSMDQYQWSKDNAAWDWLKGGEIAVKKNNFDNCDFLIRPCPLNKPQENTNRIGTCRLFSNGTTRLTDINKHAHFNKFGITPNKPTIFFANSMWEYKRALHRQHSSVVSLIEWMPKILANYFSELGVDLNIIHVGPKSWDFSVPDNLTYFYFEQLPTEDYINLLGASDLFATTNVTSMTMSTAIMMGVKCALFRNPVEMSLLPYAQGELSSPVWFRQMSQDIKQMSPFKMFPWGWHKFLGPVFENNEYTDTFLSLDLFNPERTIEQLHETLFDENAQCALSFESEKYALKLQKMAPIDDFLASVI